jgi:hypothetical protein
MFDYSDFRNKLRETGVVDSFQIFLLLKVWADADPGFFFGGGAEDYTILGALFKKKEHKVTNTKLSTKVNIYL